MNFASSLHSKREYFSVKYSSGAEIIGWKIECPINNCKRCAKSHMIIHPMIQYINNKYELTPYWHIKLHAKKERTSITKIDYDHMAKLIAMMEIMNS